MPLRNGAPFDAPISQAVRKVAMLLDNSRHGADDRPEMGAPLHPLWKMWIIAIQNFLNNLVTDYTSTMITVQVNGFSYQIPDKTQVLTITPAGNLATGTLLMPVNAYDGQPLEVSSIFNIASLTVTPSGSQTLYNAPTSLTAGTGFAYYYNAKNNAWFRRY